MAMSPVTFCRIAKRIFISFANFSRWPKGREEAACVSAAHQLELSFLTKLIIVDVLSFTFMAMKQAEVKSSKSTEAGENFLRDERGE